MSRAKWKGPCTDSKYLKKKTDEKNSLLSMPRNLEIVPKLIGLTFLVHNGKNHNELTIT